MTEQTCKNCYFSVHEGDVYYCRRYPPQVILMPQVSPIANSRQTVNMVPVGMFPPVNPAAWCGEFVPVDSKDVS